jgi:alpha-tubulin suppressor-like RCC1 family protein
MVIPKRIGILVLGGLLAAQFLAGCGSSTNTTIPTTTTVIYSHNAALGSGGNTLYTWGYNAFGQLGNGNLDNNTVATPVPNLGAVSGFAVGGNHTLALTTLGTVMSWGSNNHGQLGDATIATTGTGAFRSTPGTVTVSTSVALAGVTGIAAGAYHSLAIVAGGVRSWGYNGLGQLGNNTFTDSSVPVDVQAPLGETGFLKGVSAVAAAGSHSLALTTDGRVYAWGNNANGQLGFDPANTNGGYSALPVLVQVLSDPADTNSPLKALTDVKQIAAGGSSSYALENSGTKLWAWGYNGGGQLGVLPTTGETEFKYRPVLVTIPVVAGVTILSISAGLDHVLACMSDGSVWAWGFNGSGQLGNNTTVNSVPTQVFNYLNSVGYLTGATQVFASGNSSFAFAAVALYGWGDNGYGQLGNPVSGAALEYFPTLVQGFKP